MIGILGSTPTWASPGCQAATQSGPLPPALEGNPSTAIRPNLAEGWQACPPQGLYLDWNDPGNAWGSFVYTTVRRYVGKVNVWEIWNEPDLWNWFWQGSVDDYAQLLRVGYLATKAADPNATVLFAGLAYWANPTYYVAVLDALQALPGAAQHDYYFDVMSLHLYSNVYQIRPIAAEIQGNMASRVGPHPIWLTETGVQLWDEWTSDFPESYKTNRATAEEAAAYVIEAFSEARSIGIDRFLVFRTHDEAMTGPGGLPEYFGLVRNDLTLRPAYSAFQTTATYLYGENQVTGPFTNDGIRRITFWGTPRGRIDVVWNTTGAPVTFGLPAYLPAATAVTYRGMTSTISAADDVYTLTLAPATANTAADGSYLIGGPPILVIQADTQPPTSSLHPLPDVTFTSGVTLSWDVIDEGTGYWYAEIERAPTSTGPWTTAAGWGSTNGVLTTTVPVTTSGTTYFRLRARDNAGNWEAWPYSAEASTTAMLTRTVALSVTALLPDTIEEAWFPGPAVAYAWSDASGHVIAQAEEPSGWHVTKTVEAGSYVVTARTPGTLMAVHRFDVTPGIAPLTVSATLPLKAIVASVYMPMVTRGP